MKQPSSDGVLIGRPPICLWSDPNTALLLGGVGEETMTPPFLDQNVEVAGFEPRTPQLGADRRITWLAGTRQVSFIRMCA